MFSLVSGLPSATSASRFRESCSAASLVIRPCSTPHWRACTDCAFGFPCRSGGLVGPGCQRGLPVLARAVFRRAHGSWTTPGLRGTRVGIPPSVAFPLGAHGRRPVCVFRSSIPGPSVPLSMLHPAPHGTQRKTRGQDGSLLLSCGALSSPTTRRFIPTLALPHGHGSVWDRPLFRTVYRATTVREWLPRIWSRLGSLILNKLCNHLGCFHRDEM